MISDQRLSLSSYVSGLLSEGRTVFTADQAEQALEMGHGAFLDAAERLQRRKALLKPRQGFYVVVPPQFASWGAPPPAWYIDALMKYENQAYYVGLLKAAEFHGATHQAVMEFQVVSPKRLPRIRSGRNLIVFYFRKDIEGVTEGIERRKTDTGSVKISSAALTALDLLRYPQASGGSDSVASVILDLAPKMDAEDLATLSKVVERPVVQRLGHLLEHLGHDSLTGPLLEALRRRGSPPWTEFDRGEVRDPDFAPAPQECDPRWRVILRRVPELDE